MWSKWYHVCKRIQIALKVLVENYALIKGYALILYIYERFVKQIYALILITSQQKTNLTVDLHFLLEFI